MVAERNAEAEKGGGGDLAVGLSGVVSVSTGGATLPTDPDFSSSFVSFG
jgi:hypothetical protein